MMPKSVQKSILRAFTLATLAALMLVIQAVSSQAQWVTNGSDISNTNPGNVGIGTTTPAYPITVIKDQAGATTVAAFNRTDAMYAIASMGASRTLDWSDKFVAFGVTAPGYGVPDYNDIGLFHSKGVPLKFGSQSANDILFFTNGIANTRMTITGGGNVGIGTATPGYPLTVRSNSIAAPLNLIGGTGNIEIWKDTARPLPTKAIAFGSAIPGNPAGDDIQLSTYNGVAWSSRLTISNSTGNVGIGTATPGYPLTVRSNSIAAPLNLIGGTGNIEIWKDAAGNFPSKAIAFGSAIPGSAAGDDIQLSTYNGAAWSSRLTISNSTGNVGIGTANPATALHVNGDITVLGNINAKYQDVAEWVPSREKLSAGTVVILDIAHNNHVTASATPYDTRVAGVISAQPGISLGEAGEGKVLVATTGRVKVKVDATRGAISVGDLLVTSEVAGVAMRSQPLDLGGVPIHRPGTLIGKALEPLEKGTGEILVLLSLQ